MSRLGCLGYALTVRVPHVCSLVVIALWVSCALPDDFVKVPHAGGGEGGEGVGGGAGGAGGESSGGAGGGGGLAECPSFSGDPPFDCVDGLAFDSDDCCVAGRDCGFDPVTRLAAACSNGRCEGYRIVEAGAPNDNEARSLVVYVDEIAWTTGAAGRVMVGPLGGGGAPAELVSDPTREPTFVVAAEGNLFFTSSNAPEVFRVDSLGAPEQVASTAQGTGMGYGRLTYWDGALYFAHDAVAGGIFRANAADTLQTAVRVADAQNPRGVAADNNHVYFTEPGLGVVSRIAVQDIGGGTPEVIATGEVGATALVHDANQLYWATPGAIRTMNKNAAEVTDLATDANIADGALMIDDHFVYWVQYDPSRFEGSVWKASKYDGSGAYALIDGVGDIPVALAQDCEHVFVALSAGQIARVTK